MVYIPKPCSHATVLDLHDNSVFMEIPDCWSVQGSLIQDLSWFIGKIPLEAVHLDHSAVPRGLNKQPLVVISHKPLKATVASVHACRHPKDEN